MKEASMYDTHLKPNVAFYRENHQLCYLTLKRCKFMAFQITTIIIFQALTYKNLFYSIYTSFVKNKQKFVYYFYSASVQAYGEALLVTLMACKLIMTSQTVLSISGTEIRPHSPTRKLCLDRQL
jgi:hypothetical protein